MNFTQFYKNEKNMLWLIILVALGIRFLLMFTLKSYLIENNWSFGYEMGKIAETLATDNQFGSPYPYAEPTGPTAIVPPLYPLFLAFLFKLFGLFSTKAAIAALTANCITSAFSCIPLYYIGKELFDRSIGFLTAGIFAIHPVPIWYAINTVWDTAIFTFLAITLTYWILILPKESSFKNTALCGFFIGFIILIKTVIIAFFPFLCLWLFLKSPESLKYRISCLAILCICIFITLFPWCLRNYFTFNRFMLRSNFGLELMIENNPNVWNTIKAKGEDSDALWNEHPSSNRQEFLLYKEFGEIEYMNTALIRSKKFIKENPEKFLKLTLRRISMFWLGEWGEKNEWQGSLKLSFSISGIKKILLILPLPFMIIGILIGIQKKNSLWILIAYIFTLPVVYYMTHVCSRFRYPVEPIILLIAVYGFVQSFILLKSDRIISHP